MTVALPQVNGDVALAEEKLLRRGPVAAPGARSFADAELSSSVHPLMSHFSATKISARNPFASLRSSIKKGAPSFLAHAFFLLGDPLAGWQRW